MSRPLFLGNGHMLVGLNSFGLVHDFYFPYAGYENHLSEDGQRHKIGIWVDGKFSWLDDGTWSTSITYEDMALIGHIRALNDNLGIVLEFTDFVDSELSAFIRNVHVVNKSDVRREIRVFFHQVFEISESNRGDSAIYVPAEKAILNYKGHRNFVISGNRADGLSFDQYGIGNYGIEGKEGTYKDAEDGQLSGNAVEHGRVDSAIGFTLNIASHSSRRVNYWVAAGQTRDAAFGISRKIRDDSVHTRHAITQNFYHEWLTIAEPKILKLPKKYRHYVIKSLLIIKSHIDARGAIIASGDSQMLNYARDYYGYFWPRDGAFIIWPLIRLGYTEEAKNFFNFCKNVLTPGGYFMHKYLPDESVGSTWHAAIENGHDELPIQEDETAIVIFMLNEYMQYSNDTDFVELMFTKLVKPAIKYILEFMDKETGLPHQSFDLWEEKFQTTTYTTATVYGALVAAREIAETLNFSEDALAWKEAATALRKKAQIIFFNKDKGYFYKGYQIVDGTMKFDDTIDVSSLFGAVLFGLFDIDDPRVLQAEKTLEATLVDSPKVNGTPRYENDQYNLNDKSAKGNPWFVTSFWYAQYMVERGNKEFAEKVLNWSLDYMLPTGVLPEQIDTNEGTYISVAPLIWSQAEFINTVFDLYSARDLPDEDT